ncbi:MAG TPA: hypothetical protein VFM05_08820, partial [Candidatus Saccharimonadales bacterium]|nr:hypothetical protein [Candidatus Saccharimonadales bacterium]
LDAWLQTMRDERGYGGPVTHWWQSCLLYCGPMADWRYEGLICGYLNLYSSSLQPQWLERAITAGEDLLIAQLPNGQFLNSSFEIGPVQGGTPHEAAVDLALLELARKLRSLGDERWEPFYCAAEHNLKSYQLGELWNGSAFKDQAWNQTVVANKNATTMEALLLYEELSGCSMQQYILGAAELIMSVQVSEPGPRNGATIHLGTGPHQLAIGIYTARCLSALVRLYERYPKDIYLERAGKMLDFLLRLVVEEGTLFGFYKDGRPVACPTWISASGDLLRAMIMLKPYIAVPEWAMNHLAGLLVNRQLPSGGIPTAYGLGFKGQARRPNGRPDFRDVIPVVGWCDKAFRALSLLAGKWEPEPKEILLSDTAIECMWKGRHCIFREDSERMQLIDQRRGNILFEWKKGDWYPKIYQL